MAFGHLIFYVKSEKHVKFFFENFRIFRHFILFSNSFPIPISSFHGSKKLWQLAPSWCFNGWHHPKSKIFLNSYSFDSVQYYFIDLFFKRTFLRIFHTSLPPQWRGQLREGISSSLTQKRKSGITFRSIHFSCGVLGSSPIII